jgi:glycine betaine/proline transport system ATP-binding protein
MSDEEMIRTNNLFKIFGNEPDKAIDLIKKGYSKKEILSKIKQVVAIKEINFTLNKGEIFVLMGLSGSGKSTLLRCINRLVQPTVGNVYLNFENKTIDITNIDRLNLLKIRKDYISMIFQHFALLPWRTVIQNVKFGMEIKGIEKELSLSKSQEMLNLVGLKEWANSMPSELSGGMKQRVGLARALATEAPILLMDEPFSALDPLIKVKMQDELLKLQNSLKKSIIFVTHDLDEALKLGDKIAIMENGQIVQIGNPEMIITNPKTEYVAKFVEHADVSNVLTAKSVAMDISNFNVEKSINYMKVIIDENNIIEIYFNDSNDISKIKYNNNSFKVKKLNKINEDINEDSNKYIYVVNDKIPIKLIMEARIKSKLPIILLEKNEIKGLIREEDIIEKLLKK